MPRNSNSSSITQFLLLAFTDTRELQLLHFWLFLGIHLAAFLGNGLIITTIACDQHLHTAMYFFLFKLSLLDLGSISTTVPKSMAISFWDTRVMSSECSLLTIMVYDRYVAICKPLHYGTFLGSRPCAAARASGFLTALLHTANTFSLPLCKGNAVDQFFCELPQTLKLSCSDAYLREGRHKAFSMCLPHLAVVSLFISTGIFAHWKPPSISSPSLDLVVSVLYSVVPPTVNSLIYSMRNKEINDVLWKRLCAY
ncbi:olfactory receptor 14J1-like [Caloenas nicobarica]|uniref:olfactory receptor 14J1-like n=1 Tax=Caloenas nicobarica TaxID=187106 RepID=UPI0032B7BE20